MRGVAMCVVIPVAPAMSCHVNSTRLTPPAPLARPPANAKTLENIFRFNERRVNNRSSRLSVRSVSVARQRECATKSLGSCEHLMRRVDEGPGDGLSSVRMAAGDPSEKIKNEWKEMSEQRRTFTYGLA